MKYKVLIPQDISEEGKKYLLDRGYQIKICSDTSLDTIKNDVQDCDAILARTAHFPAEVIKAGKKLKVIARHGVGIDNIDVQAAVEHGVYVTYAPFSNLNTVAEHTIGLIIAVARNMLKCDREHRKGNFEIRNQLTGIDLEGKTLGLIGTGKIGLLVAKKATLGLDMKVIGYDPYINPKKVPNIELVNNRDFVFRNADFISLHMPVTRETRGIVGKREFEMMKQTAYFINTARGELVDEAELVRALKEGSIAGAGLDVYAEEPTSKCHPLFDLDNVILTPHNAAHTKEAKVRMAVHAAMGIDEVLSGRKPSWPCNNPETKECYLK